MILRRRRKSDDLAPGDDSFLDIVANLVGVLIILVVVVGAHAGAQIHDHMMDQAGLSELEQLEEQHQKASRHASALLQDNRQLENRIAAEKNVARLRKLERDRLLVQVTQAKNVLQQKKKSLTTEQQKAFEQSEFLASLRKEYRQLDSQYTAIKSVARKEQEIEHFPTPIAKTVFSEEIHFRLRQGKIVYVPMNELVELMKDEWREKARKLKSASETTETVGPVDDFRLQYQLRAKEQAVQTAYGDSTERLVEFARFILVPTRDDVGVPLDAALQDGTDFRQWVDQANPGSATFSLWVYPDSFDEFNQLKKWLYERGFKTACWPLSKNSPISGGPSGYRSTAQ